MGRGWPGWARIQGEQLTRTLKLTHTLSGPGGAESMSKFKSTSKALWEAGLAAFCVFSEKEREQGRKQNGVGPDGGKFRAIAALDEDSAPDAEG